MSARNYIPKKCLFPIIFSILTAITIFFWYREQCVIFLGDEAFPFNPNVDLFRRSYSWLEVSGGSLSTALFSYFTSIWFFINSELHIPVWLAQAILYALLLFLQFCSIFILNKYLLIKVFPDESRLRISFFSFLGALFYVFNVYQMTTIWTDLKGMSFSAAFYPLFILSTFKLLSKDGENESKYIPIGAISLLFSIWGSPKIWIPFVIYTLFLIFWYVKFDKLQKRILFNKDIMALGITSLLLITPLILTTVFSFLSQAPSYSLPTDIRLYEQILNVRSRDTTLINTFHFWGMNMLNEPIYSKTKILEGMITFLKNSTVNHFTMFIPALIIFVPLVLKKIEIGKYIYLYLLLIFTITAISIIHVPVLKDPYLLAFRNFRIFTAFNEPWSNFGLFYIFLISLLIPFSLQLLAKQIFSKIKFVPILLLFLYLAPLGFLFLTGGFIPQEGIFNSKVKIPEYVLESINIIESQSGNGKVLFLPYFKGKESPNWTRSYWGYSIFPWLTKKEVIATGFYRESIPLKLLSQLQNKEDFEKYAFSGEGYINLLQVLGVKWVVVRRDMRWIDLMSESKPDVYFIEQTLSPFSDEIGRFNEIKIFELRNTLPPVYMVEQIILTDLSNIDKFMNLLENNRINKHIVFIDADFLSKPDFDLSETRREVEEILRNKTIIYLFEAESDLYRDNANISKKFGGEASNGEVLEIADGKAWQEIEIIKDSTYRLAIRAKGDFRVQIDDKEFKFHNSNLTYWYSHIFELNEGEYNLTLTSLETPIANFSFESVSPNIEKGIIGESPQGIVSFSNDSYSGKRSLKVSSNVSEGLLWFRTIEVNVTPKERYLAITHMKYENVVASYISMEGYNETSGEWIELGQIPSRQDGTSDWKEYKQMLTIPEDITKIRFVLNAGWIEDLGEGKATTWFDDIRIYPVNDYLDVIWLYSTENNETLNELFKTNETPAEVINYTKVNPTKYVVKVNATKPFMLSFAETYDSLWEARVYKDGEKVEVAKSIPLYSVINGFCIDEAGDLEIEIRYKPQEWFVLGLWISGMTFIGCIGYLFYDWRRGKGGKWALRIGARLHNAGNVVNKGFREGVQRLKKKQKRKN